MVSKSTIKVVLIKSTNNNALAKSPTISESAAEIVLCNRMRAVQFCNVTNGLTTVHAEANPIIHEYVGGSYVYRVGKNEKKTFLENFATALDNMLQKIH